MHFYRHPSKTDFRVNRHRRPGKGVGVIWKFLYYSIFSRKKFFPFLLRKNEKSFPFLLHKIQSFPFCFAKCFIQSFPFLLRKMLYTVLFIFTSQNSTFFNIRRSILHSFTFAKFYIPLHLQQYSLRPFCSVPVCRHHSLFAIHMQDMLLYFAT